MNIDYTKRVYGLDVYRAIAILLVVFGHGKILSGEYKLFQNFPSIPLMDGVELFFVLSGFLIGGILIKIIEKEDGLSFKSLRNFWKRRWFRTLPNYYLILLINVLFVKYGIIGNDMESFNWKFLFFIHNFHEGFMGFFWESWSLSIEEWFYLILPIVLILGLRFLPKKKAIFLGIVVLILLPLIYRISISSNAVDGFLWDVSIRKVVITRLDAIIYGVFAAFVKFYFPEFWKKNTLLWFGLGIAIIYLNTLIPREPNDFYSKTFVFSVTSIGAMLLLPYADSVKKFKNAFLGKSITHISLISYSMYLVNLALVAQVIEKNFPYTEGHLASVGYFKYFVYWFVTVVVSTLLFRFYERPMMNLRDKF